jgi:membrane protein DedA with SNARE-associated domain
VDQVQHWLGTLPPVVVYLLVAGVICVESLGVPLPGEVALVSAALLAASGVTDVWWVAISASLGAVVGDSIGYSIGRRGGRAMLERLGRRFPKHLGPPHLARAERAFDRWGVWAVFFGRFVALLRILAGPLAGALRVPYPRFLVANASGGIIWASGTAFAIWGLGRAAEQWLSSFSWVALAVAVFAGMATTMLLRRRAGRAMRGHGEPDDADQEPAPAGTTR